MAKTQKDQRGLEGYPPALMCQELEQFGDDVRVFNESKVQLLEQYAEQWVAILDGEVVAHGEAFDAVLDLLDAKDLPRRRAVVKFLTATEQLLIL